MNLTTNNSITMTSLELVDYINAHRQSVATIEKPYVELHHRSFMSKVPQVLGVKDAAKFIASSFYQGNGSAKLERQIYRFPKREACLMAMSYSYELQAQVFDRMTAMEEELKEKATNIPLGDLAASMVKMAEAYGFKGNQALLSADRATQALTGYSPLQLMGATHLISETQQHHFTPTELGSRLGLTARQFNRKLFELGLQDKINDKWVMTEAGSSYGVLLDTGKRHGDSSPVAQLKWYDSVLNLI